MISSSIKQVLGIHSKKRLFWEVDVLRGFALLFMILVHFFWDLLYFDLVSFSPDELFGSIFRPRYLFLFLVGVSLFLSFDSGKKFSFFLKRGLLVFSWGLLSSLFVWLLLDEIIIFGVLHLIGFSIITSYIFLKNRFIAFFVGLLCLLIGGVLSFLSFNTSWFVWLGFRPVNFSFLDYFPVFPWFGLILLGFFAGSLLYSSKKRLFKLNDYSDVFPFRFLGFIGRNSLFIYLIHQPILFSLFFIYTIL